MWDEQIRNIYELIQKGQFQASIKQSTNILDKLKIKSKDGLHSETFQLLILQLISLRSLSYLKLGYILQAENEMSKILQIKPLDEDIVIIVWHYYVMHGNFLCGFDKLKQVANYLEDVICTNLLSEQFEIDILSLYYYLKEYKTMKSLCNKYLKKNKRPYLLALNIFASFSIFQDQMLSLNPDNNESISISENKEDKLLLLLADKYLDENGNLEDNLKLYGRRVLFMVYLIKLFVLRVKCDVENYFICLDELGSFENKSRLYPCVGDEKLVTLKNLMILQNLEKNLSNNNLNNLSLYKRSFFELIKNLDINIDLDWDSIRLIKMIIVNVFQITMETNKELTTLSDNNIFASNNTSLINQSSQSSQITNCSSFLTQSTISSLYGNLLNYESTDNDSYLSLLERIFALLNTFEYEDDIDYYENKNKLLSFFVGKMKGRIILLELFIDILKLIENSYFDHLDNFYDNLLLNVNNEILGLMNSNNVNIIIDLRVALCGYFKLNLSLNNVVKVVFDDLLLLLEDNFLALKNDKGIDLDYFTLRIQLLTIFNQIKATLKEDSHLLAEDLVLTPTQIISILKMNIKDEVIKHFLVNGSCKSSFLRFMVSISVYCLSIPMIYTDNSFGSDSNANFNPTSICLSILSFMNDRSDEFGLKNDYSVNYLLSELLPIIGTFSISHYIRNNILQIKRSQITTLNVYGNYLEMLSCPFIGNNNSNCKNLDNPDILFFVSNNPQKEMNFNCLFNSHFNIFGELRETCIESLRESSFSLINLLETIKLSDEMFKDNAMEIFFSIIFLNNIHSVLLYAISIKKNDFFESFFSLFNNFEPTIVNFLNKNDDRIVENYHQNSIKHDLSPVITYSCPIYETKYSFDKVSSELLPTNYFTYCDNLNIDELEAIVSNQKLNSELLRFVNGTPKLKYNLSIRLKMWLLPIVLVSDIVLSKNELSIEELKLKNKFFADLHSSSKYSYLLSNFDLELLNNILIPLVNFLIKIVNYQVELGQERLRKDEISKLIEFIDSTIFSFINTNIVSQIDELVKVNTEDKLLYSQIKTLLENISSFIFGPSLILAIIQFWISSQFSKKQIGSIHKALTNSHINCIQKVSSHFEHLINSFNGTTEIRELRKLSELLNANICSSLNGNSSSLSIEKLVDSQLYSIKKSSSALTLTLCSLRNSLK
ncbi:hypothetical protein HWI79_2119 [Cryptosporidium felis]|nr:hypothetical protein HWI79_2119 [Cryptosporidium felis]